LYDLCIRYSACLCPQQIHAKLNAILYSIIDKNGSNYLVLRDSLQLKLILNTLRADLVDERVDFESFLKILFLVKFVIINRPLNLIKFFTGENVDLIKVLNRLFWHLYNKYGRSDVPIQAIGSDTLTRGSFNMNQVIELLIEITHYYLLYATSMQSQQASKNALYEQYSAYFIKFLFADDINICFLARKCLVYLLKAKKIRKVESAKDVAKKSAEAVPSIVAIDDQIRLPLFANENINLDQADEDEMIQLAMALSLNEQGQFSPLK
jgi:hypothetical protein